VTAQPHPTAHTAPAGPGAPFGALAEWLPQVPAAQAELSRVLHDRRLQALLGQGRTWAVVRAAPGATPPGDCYRLRARSDHGPMHALISVPGLASLAWAAASDTPAPLRPVLAQAALGAVVQAAAQIGIAGFELLGLDAAAAPTASSSEALWWQLREHAQVLAWFAALQAPAQTWPALRSVTGAATPPWPPGMQLGGRALLCHRLMPLALLRSLQTGDVLLTPLPCTALAAEPTPVGVGLRWGTPGGQGLHVQARLCGHLLTLEGPLHMSSEPSPDTPPDTSPEPRGPEPAASTEAAAQSEPDTLGAMELPLRFELDTVSIALADLQAIQPGYVIELPTLLRDASVRLVACGHTVGHAELVAVGERLGARVTRMVLSDEPANRH
jgi:type III secretion protein Q